MSRDYVSDGRDVWHLHREDGRVVERHWWGTYRWPWLARLIAWLTV